MGCPSTTTPTPTQPDPTTEDPIDDVSVTLPSSCPRQVQICVRDYSCEDGDQVRVSVNGNQVFSGELFNTPRCFSVPVNVGANTVSMLALNGTGGKGGCPNNINSGEITVHGGNTQRWAHPARAGSSANLNVRIGPPGGSCTPGGSPTTPTPQSSQYVSIAFGWYSQTGRSDKWAWSGGRGTSASAAQSDAGNRCARELGRNCQRSVNGYTGCYSLAVTDCPTGTCNRPGYLPGFAIRGGSTRSEAESSAIRACRAESGGSTCSIALADGGGSATICGRQ